MAAQGIMENDERRVSQEALPKADRLSPTHNPIDLEQLNPQSTITNERKGQDKDSSVTTEPVATEKLSQPVEIERKATEKPKSAENEKIKEDEEDEEEEDEDVKEQKFLAPFNEKIRSTLKDTIEDVTPMRGGAYNGIIKVKLKSSDGGSSSYAIYRIPRDWKAEISEPLQSIKDTAALHSLLRSENSLNFNVPAVLEYDMTADNYLQHPYTLMEHVDGIPLDEVYRYLPLYAKIQIAEQLAAVIWKMEQITFEKSGRLVAADDMRSSMKHGSITPGEGTMTSPIKLTGFGVCDRDDSITMNDPATSVKELVDAQIEGWQEVERRYLAQEKLSGLTSILKRMNAMEKVTRKIDRFGYFDDDGGGSKNVLHHWDLHARNIIVQFDPSLPLSPNISECTRKKCVFFDSRTEPPGTRIKIAAILDWDEICAVPTVLSRVPPYWLWDFDAPRELTSPNQRNNKRLCRYDADLYPFSRWKAESGILSGHSLEIKRRFDLKIEELLPGYCNDAYCTRGRMLRRLWGIVKDGLFYKDCFEIQTTFMKDFNSSLPVLEKYHREEMEAKTKLKTADDIPDTMDGVIEGQERSPDSPSKKHVVESEEPLKIQQPEQKSGTEPLEVIRLLRCARCNETIAKSSSQDPSASGEPDVMTIADPLISVSRENVTRQKLEKQEGTGRRDAIPELTMVSQATKVDEKLGDASSRPSRRKLRGIKLAPSCIRFHGRTREGKSRDRKVCKKQRTWEQILCHLFTKLGMPEL